MQRELTNSKKLKQKLLIIGISCDISPEVVIIMYDTRLLFFCFLYDSSKINLCSLVVNQNDSDIGYNNYVCKVNLICKIMKMF